MIHDPVAAADRIIAMVQSGAVITAQGTHLPTSIDSICVHGDGPKAVETARYVRERLEAAGITIAPFAP
jgi:UPF0271 protein